MNPLRIIIITGMAGSGKTTVAHALEDEGFFVIDNLPIALIARLAELLLQARAEVSRLALVVDAREGIYLKELPSTLDGLRETGCKVEVLFLEAGDEALNRRFKETRRRHPLSKGGSIDDGIRVERLLLRDVKAISDRTIDTTDMNVHQLRKVVEDFVGQSHSTDRLSVSVQSFGFKYGIPTQADLVFDARFLPNPYFIPKFKGLKGTEPSVAAFVVQSPEAQEFISIIMRLLEFQIPLFAAEGKVYLNVAFGCTGGQHRSVAMAEEVSARLREKGIPVKCRHRDIDRDS